MLGGRQVLRQLVTNMGVSEGSRRYLEQRVAGEVCIKGLFQVDPFQLVIKDASTSLTSRQDIVLTSPEDASRMCRCVLSDSSCGQQALLSLLVAWPPLQT